MSIAANGGESEQGLWAQTITEHQALIAGLERDPNDKAAWAALGSFFERNPVYHRHCVHGAARSRKSLFAALFGEHWEIDWPAYRDTVLEEELALAGDNPSPIVKALSEQAATESLWLKAIFVAIPGSKPAREKLLFELSDEVQRRYLRTLKMLAVVRRLEKGMDLHITHHMAQPAARPVNATVVSPRAPEALPMINVPSALPEGGPSINRRETVTSHKGGNP